MLTIWGPKYAELGRRPVEIIKSWMTGFWLWLVNGKETKLSTKRYYMILMPEHKWIRCIRDILVLVGRLDLFHKSVIDNPRSVKMSISRVLFDLHIQEWVQKLDASSKGKFHYSFKHDLTFQNYLSKLDSKHYLPIIKYRTSNHKLPVETGQWKNVPLDEKICQLCTKSDIDDEFHYLLCCTFFESERKRLLKPYFLIQDLTCLTLKSYFVLTAQQY